MMASATYSFACKKDPVERLELLATEPPSDAPAAAVSFKILRGSMTANNKFYWGPFGEKPPFSFNKCYPVDPAKSKLVEGGAAPENYFHPVVWGICEVTSSKVEGVEVGTEYMAMLPLGETVSFAKAHVKEDDEGILIVDRPATFAVYNQFSRIDADSPLSTSCEHSDTALVCFPGIVTGHGLYYRMLRTKCYGVDAVVVTSASSKVALAMALYMKNDKAFENTRIVGYTSAVNMEFCRKTGLYDEVIGYSELVPKDTKCVMIDIAGRGDIYTKNSSAVVQLLVVGNSSGTEDKDGTFKTFSYVAMAKMVITMMGLPAWLHSWMQPKQQLYAIWEDMADMSKEYGAEKLKQISKEKSLEFCKWAKDWMSVTEATTEEEVGQAFKDILQGSVPPTEFIALDVAKAVAHRKK